MQVSLRHAQLSTPPAVLLTELHGAPLLQARQSAAQGLANMLERNLLKPIID